MNDNETLHYYDLPNQLPGLRAEMEAHKDRVLSGEQRALPTVILEQGSSYGQVARLSGEHASTISRRFRRLLAKLSHRTGGTAPDKTARLAPLNKAILSGYYLHGMNQSQVAARLGISRYRVRKALDEFATHHRGSAPVPRSPKSEDGCLAVPPAAQERSRSCTR